MMKRKECARFRMKKSYLECASLRPQEFALLKRKPLLNARLRKRKRLVERNLSKLVRPIGPNTRLKKPLGKRLSRRSKLVFCKNKRSSKLRSRVSRRKGFHRSYKSQADFKPYVMKRSCVYERNNLKWTSENASRKKRQNVCVSRLKLMNGDCSPLR